MEPAYPSTPGAQHQSGQGDDEATLAVHALVYPERAERRHHNRPGTPEAPLSVINSADQGTLPVPTRHFLSPLTPPRAANVVRSQVVVRPPWPQPPPDLASCYETGLGASFILGLLVGVVAASAEGTR
jgi:hypothetical protein